MSHHPSPHDTPVHMLDAGKQIVFMVALGMALALLLTL